MKKKNKKIFYGWWIVIGSLLVTGTVVPSVMAMSNKFLISITKDMGISKSAFTLSNSLLHAMGIFFSPFIAKRLAKGNMKKIQTISVLLFVLVFASYSLAKKPIHFYISSVVLGICYLHTSLIPIGMMITNWFDKKRGLAMSIAMSGIGIGGFIFSPLITSWISNYGWRTTYLIYAVVIAAIALPVSLFIFIRSPEDIGLKPYGQNIEEKNKIKDTSNIRLSLTMKETLTKPFFIMLIIATLANGLINMGALGQFPPALEELHGPIIQATIISLYSILGMFGKLLLGWINDKFGIIQSIVFGCIAFGLTFLFMLFSQNVYMAYIAAIFLGIGMGVGNVIPPLVTSAIVGADKYSEAYGYVNSAIQIGLSFGSLLVASIFDKTGSYRTAWIIMIGLTAVTMFGWIISYNRSLKYRVKE